ncbi:MAG: lycopene cyclase domain-containing protein [Candidatus Pacearchaeota archaeon]|jgi:hypothetical protein
MVNYQYTYLIGVGIYFVIWLLLFIKRKDTRKEMLIISLLFGLIGPLVETIHIKDWWKPLTITNTPIGIEDFLFGFFIGGAASVIYLHLFNKKIRKKDSKINLKFNYSIPFLLATTLFFGSFFIFKLNTFISSLIALIIPILLIYYFRKDLIKNSIISGILIWIVMIVGYTILDLITPGFFEKFWYFENIGKIMFLKIPLEEHIWFFLAGAFIGPLYEYWQEAKLVNAK